MPYWVRRAAAIAVFWSYVWLLVLQSGAVFHPILQKQQQQVTREQTGEGLPTALPIDETFWARLTSDPVAFFTAVLATFTLVLGGSTMLLWWETRKGGITSERLANASESQGAISKQLADAAGQQVAILALQTDIQTKQHEIGRRQYLAQHRPRIIVRVIQRPMQKTKGLEVPRPFVWVTVVNVGGNDAFITHFGGDLVHKEVGPGSHFGPPGLDARARPIEQIALVPGQRTTFEVIAPVGFTWQVFALLSQLSSSAVYAIGNVIYTDDLGIERHTAYWRQYDFTTENFTASEREDEEYVD